MKPIALVVLVASVFVSSVRGQTTPPPAVPPPVSPGASGQPAPTPGVAPAVSGTPVSPSSPAADAAPDKPPLKPEELEQLLAPLALYPDSLLTQMLMASTYPLEIVQADRWAKANKTLKGDALAKELEKQPWDPSVKSLINFPDVLTMMNDKLDLTMKIGDAFLDQQQDVMNTIQKLRAKANETGNLKSNEQQKVVIQQAPPTTQQTTVVVNQVPPQPQVIVIEPAQPSVVYVPTYNPTVVYGAWPYPAYPPAPYYPPNYVASNLISFGAGVAVGAAWGYAWGNCNWGHGDVNIDVNRNTNINNNIDRSKYQQNINNRQNNVQGNRGGGNTWKHDSSHRQGVPYRDNKTASQYGRGNAQNAQSRDQFRGRAEAGRQDLNRGGASDFRGTGGDFSGNRGGAGAGGAGAANRGGAGAGGGGIGSGAGAGNRGNAGAGGAGGAGANRPSARPANRGGSSGSSANRGSAMSGVGGGGSGARQSSQRGQASRSSSGGGASRSGGGGSRGGGGGSRGGGGGRGRSDVALKSDFASVDPSIVLEKVAKLPITTWNYKDDPDSRHLGPMAQDFHRAFGIGSDDKTITFLDEGGVALSAIQGLNQKLDQRDTRIKALEREVAELKALVQKLADKPSAAAASKN